MNSENEYSGRQRELVAEKSQEIIELKRKIVNQQTENNSLKGRLTYYQTQDDRLRETIQKLEAKNNELIHQAQVEKEAQNEELTDLEATAQTYYQTSQQQLADTQQELEDTQQALENTQQTQEQAEIQAKRKANNLKKALAREGKKWKTKNQNLIKDNLQTKKALDKETKKSQGKIKRVQQQLTKKRKEVKNLKQNNIDLKKELIQQALELSITQQKLKNQSNNKVQCSHNDYDELKTKIVKIQEEKVKIIQEKQNQERVIVEKLATELNLNQEQNNSIEKIISTVKILLNKPPIIKKAQVENTERIKELEKEVKNWQNIPFGEDLETIKKIELSGLEELLPGQLNQQFITQIQQAQNYSELVQFRNSLLAKHLAQIKNEEVKEVVNLPELKSFPSVKPNANAERYILISLLLVSLISVGGLLVKLRNSRIKK